MTFPMDGEEFDFGWRPPVIDQGDSDFTPGDTDDDRDDDDTDDDDGGFRQPGMEHPGGTNRIPGQYQIWKIGGRYWAVWTVPRLGALASRPPIYMAYEVRGDQMTNAFGLVSPDTDQEMSMIQFQQLGGLNMGNINQVNNADEHPFDQFVHQWDEQSAVAPWLNDPEILTITIAAMLEGRPVTDAELHTTTWWQTHNEGERNWLSLYANDPSTATQQLDDRRLQVRDILLRLGVDNAPNTLINLIADKWTMGHWSQTFAESQLRKLADPASSGTLDPSITEALGNTALDTTRDREGYVKELTQRWLGPRFGDKGQAWIADWAGRLRNNPDAELELVEALQGQRLALFPNHTNPNLTYEDIADPVRLQFEQVWGQEYDEYDPFFYKIAQMSDNEEATRTLRTEGLKRGVDRVMNDFQGDLLRSFGGQVRRMA